MSDAADTAQDVKPEAEFVVVTGADGLPTDKALRRMALSMLSKAPPNSYTRKENLLYTYVEVRPADINGDTGERLPSYYERKRRAEAVLESLIVSGRLRREGHDALQLVPNEKRQKPVTPEARQANYLAYAQGVGDRVGGTPEMKAKVTDLFLRIRNVYGLRRTTFGEGRAMVVPAAIRIDADGIAITEALVIAVLLRGVKVLKADERTLKTVFGPSGELLIELEPKLRSKWQGPKLRVREMSVSPWASQSGNADHEIAKIAKGALASLNGQREGVSAYLGEELSTAQWLSFLTSLRRAGDIRKHVRTTLFAILDKDVRAACLRHLGARYGFHDWLCGKDDITRERRLQASAAYPILSPRLAEFESVIDAGEPLAPALAEKLSATPAAIRHLGGQNWQAIGSFSSCDPQGHEFKSLLGYLGVLVPDDHPRKRKEWVGATKAATQLDNLFGYPLPDNVAHAVRRLDSATRLVNANFRDALNDFVGSLGKALSGHWDDQWMYKPYGDADFDDAWENDDLGYCVPKGRHSSLTVLARAVGSVIAGENGSVKRLAAFNNDWHRGVARRKASVNMLRRLSMGDETKRWEPMTAEPFTHAKGTLRWLCDEDALVIEGQEMKHCVGTYDTVCHQYGRHIASITDLNGVRSTAEFLIDGKKVSCIQHYAYGDSKPPEDCVAVVEAFLKLANRRKSPIDFEGLEKAAAARRETVSERHRKGRGNYAMSPDVAESLVRLYDDCLPKSVRGLSVEDWRKIVSELAKQSMPALEEKKGSFARLTEQFAAARAA